MHQGVNNMQEGSSESSIMTFQHQFDAGGPLVSPSFVRNLSREFNKVMSSTNLEDLCLDRYDPTMLSEADQDKAQTPCGLLTPWHTYGPLFQGVAIGVVLGWALRHQWQKRFFS